VILRRQGLKIAIRTLSTYSDSTIAKSRRRKRLSSTGD
jgi:hypothetical protein